MQELIKILKMNELSVNQCRTLDIPYQNSILELLVVCYARDRIVAYLNHCPHTGVNLNWQQDQCFDFSKQYLACSVHGALFQPDNGKCIYGPCLGQSLVPVELIIVDGHIYIDPTDIEKGK